MLPPPHTFPLAIGVVYIHHLQYGWLDNMKTETSPEPYLHLPLPLALLLCLSWFHSSTPRCSDPLSAWTCVRHIGPIRGTPPGGCSADEIPGDTGRNSIYSAHCLSPLSGSSCTSSDWLAALLHLRAFSFPAFTFDWAKKTLRCDQGKHLWDYHTSWLTHDLQI